MLTDLLSKLFSDQLAPRTVKRVFIGLCLLPIWVGMLYIAANPEMSTTESSFLGSAERLAATSRMTISSLDYVGLTRHFYSMPLVSIAKAPLALRIALLRSWGLVLLLLTLILAYQSAQKIFPGKHSESLLVLALVATNNRLFSTSLVIGGDAFLYFLLALFFYFLLELTDDMSAFDLVVCLGLIYLMTQVDPQLTLRVLIPLLFLTIAVTLGLNYGDKLARYAPKSPRLRAGLIVLTAGAGLVAAGANETVRALLGAPLSIPPAVVSALSWPGIIVHLSRHYGGSELLSAGFNGLSELSMYLYQIIALVGLVGFAMLARRVIGKGVRAERAAVQAAGPTPDVDMSEAAGVNFVFSAPSRELLKQVNLPGLMAVVFTPLLVFFAADAYTFPGLIRNGSLFVLLLPLTTLTVLGIRQLINLESTRSIVVGLIAAILVVNGSTMLISALWS